VAVYVPNARRRVRMALAMPDGAVLSGGTLKVSYRERPEAGGRLLAESAVALP
jgi:hypothetical protein